MKQIAVPGFSTDVRPNTRPAIVVYGQDNTGTTRFGTTAPCDEGYIGWLAIDANSKITLEEQKEKNKLPIIVNKEPLISHDESMRLAMEDNQEKVKEIYKGVVGRVFDQLVGLARHPDIESIVVDRISQVFDIILFSHFGRRNQIDTFQRGGPNQDMIDLINALRHKNLVLCAKASEIYADTGEVITKGPRAGEKKQAGTGKYKPDGFGQIGRFVTAVIELTSKKGKLVGEDDDEKLKEKFRARVAMCKGSVLMEGRDLHEYGVSGDGITWDNVLMVIGAKN